MSAIELGKSGITVARQLIGRDSYVNELERSGDHSRARRAAVGHVIAPQMQRDSERQGLGPGEGEPNLTHTLLDMTTLIIGIVGAGEALIVFGDIRIAAALFGIKVSYNTAVHVLYERDKK